ncbi:MAG: hypothetical protein RPU35_04055 [Candidatus Sedimenticola sp. (ex Thyasira tokunagai)]
MFANIAQRFSGSAAKLDKSWAAQIQLLEEDADKIKADLVTLRLRRDQAALDPATGGEEI